MRTGNHIHNALQWKHIGLKLSLLWDVPGKLISAWPGLTVHIQDSLELFAPLVSYGVTTSAQ